MKHVTCGRSWQAEAVEDGRLSGDARASFERHAQTCRSCADERRGLAALREAAGRLPALAASSLERRRQRQNLLGRANDLAQHAPRSGRWRLVAASAVIGLGAAAVAALAITRTGASQVEPHEAAVRTPAYAMQASPGSVWHIAKSGPTLRLALERGVFRLHVEKLVAGQRFVASLPDGELEVRGTRFVVDVDGTRTLRVGVSEGHVALRIRGSAERLLGAGDEWVPSAPSEAPKTLATLGRASPGPPPHRPTAARGARRAVATAGPSRPRAPHLNPDTARSRSVIAASSPLAPARVAAQPAPDAPSGTAPDPAAKELKAAIGAFRKGDFARSEKLFTAFETEHPGDARAEDAAFLRAVARLRRGDRSGARALARQYLSRYPHGLRREEAQRLLAR